MEFKRVFSKKAIVLFLILVIINCAFFYKTQVVNGDNEIYSTVTEWDSTHSIFDVYKQYERNLEYEDVKDSYVPKERVNSTEYAFYKKSFEMAVRQTDYIDHYAQSVDAIINDADTKLSIGIYSKKGTYVRSNLLKTRYDFSQIRDIPVNNGNYKGFESAAEYTPTSIFILAMLSFIILRFYEERKSGLIMIVRSSTGGRAKLTLQRLVILFGASFFITMVLEMSVYMESIYLYGGLENIYNPVQSAQNFAQCTWSINFFQFIFLGIAAKGLAMFSLAMIFWIVMELVDSHQIMIVILALMIGTEVLLFKLIPAQDSFAFLKYFNILGLINVMIYIINYSNVGAGSFIMSVNKVILYFSIITICTTSTVVLIRSIYCKAVRRKNHIISVVEGGITKYCGIVFASIPIYFKEIYKLLFTQRGILVLALAVFLLLQGLVSVGVTYNEVQSGVNDYYAKANEVQDKEVFTNSYKEDLTLWIQNARQKVKEYNESEKSVYASQLSQEIAVQTNILKTVTVEQEYRNEQLATYNRECGIIKQTEFQTLTGVRMDSYEEYNAFLALLSVIIIIFGTFSFEKKNNMTQLITSSTMGYKKNSVVKIIAAFSVILVVWGLIYGISFYNSVKVYGVPLSDFKYPVQSILSMADYPFSISIAGYFILENVKRLLIMIFVMLWTLFISSKMKYNYGVFLSLIILMPYIFYFLGLELFKIISVVNWMI